MMLSVECVVLCAIAALIVLLLHYTKSLSLVSGGLTALFEQIRYVAAAFGGRAIRI